MVRDELMQRVVADSEEPITPFISRVRDLYEKLGISSVLVAGSSGSYFHVADTVIQMKEYVLMTLRIAQNHSRGISAVYCLHTPFFRSSLSPLPAAG